MITVYSMLGNIGNTSKPLITPMQSKELLSFLFFLCWGGPDIVDIGPLPGPTRPRVGLGKGPGRGPARFAPISGPVDQF